MVTTVTMPQLGEGVSEGTIGRWLKQPRDRVELDEPLVEVVTEKVNAEVPSPAAGTLVRILAPEGAKVTVLAPIAEIDEDSGVETIPGAVPAPTPQVPPPGEHVGRATPAVRRLAGELGVDLAEIAAAAPGRRIGRDDVIAYAGQRSTAPLGSLPAAPVPAPEPQPQEPAPAPAPAPASAATPTPPTREDEVIPLSRLRLGIAAQMTRAGAVPHAYVTAEIDMTPVVRRRASIRAEYQAREGISIGFVPFVVKAVVEALRRHPDLNAHWTEQGLIRKRQINVGIAVAVDDGLLVPVVHDADQLSVNGLNHALVEVAARAREGRLRLGDVQGGTFTVDNAGAFGSTFTVPLLNVPEIAIVTMEAIVKRPVVREEAGGDVIAVRSTMTMVAGFDHRATDGAQVGRFLQDVRAWLESVDERTPLW